jgi:hypothetical protein
MHSALARETGSLRTRQCVSKGVLILARRLCVPDNLPRGTAQLYAVIPDDDVKERFATCAIVGNSGSMLAAKHGRAIDAHDLVYRFNQVRSCSGGVSVAAAEHRPTAMQKLRIERLRFGAGRQKMALERWTNPKRSRRTCTREYELQ